MRSSSRWADARGGRRSVWRRRRRRDLSRGSLAIDMSTIAPSASRAIGERLAEGDRLPRGPRAGSSKGRGRHAHDHGRGEPATERARPLFETMGERIVLVAHRPRPARRCSPTRWARCTPSLWRSRSPLQCRAGLDPDAFLEVARQRGHSTVLGLEGPPDVRRELRAALLLEHMLKTCATACRRGAGGRAAARHARRGALRAAAEQGHEEDDFAAVVTAVDSPG